MLSFSSGEVTAGLVGIGGWQEVGVETERVRTACIDHLRSPIKDQIRVLHSDTY